MPLNLLLFFPSFSFSLVSLAFFINRVRLAALLHGDSVCRDDGSEMTNIIHCAPRVKAVCDLALGRLVLLHLLNNVYNKNKNLSTAGKFHDENSTIMEN